PPDLDAILADRGYAVRTPTAVQAAAVPTVLERLGTAPPHRVRVEEALGDDWFSAYCAAEGYEGDNASARRVILGRITGPTAYASADVNGERTAVGLGVLEGDWLGVFCMATRPDCRRRGAASAVLHRLAEWAAGRRATRMYLQVMDDSARARALYAGAGVGGRDGDPCRRR